MPAPYECKVTEGGGTLDLFWEYAAPVNDADGVWLFGITSAQRSALLASDGDYSLDMGLVTDVGGSDSLLSVMLQSNSGVLQWVWVSSYFGGSTGVITTDHCEPDIWHSVVIYSVAGTGCGVLIDNETYGLVVSNPATPTVARVQVGFFGGGLTGVYYIGQAGAGLGTYDTSEFYEDWGSGDFSEWTAATAAGGTTIAVVDTEFTAPDDGFFDNFESGLGEWTATGAPALSQDGFVTPSHCVEIDATDGSECYLQRTTVDGLPFPGSPNFSQSFSISFGLYIEDWAPFWDGGTYFGPWVASWSRSISGFSQGVYLDPTSSTTGNLGIAQSIGSGNQVIDMPAGEWVPVVAWAFNTTSFGNDNPYGAGSWLYMLWVNGVPTDPVVLTGQSGSDPDGIFLGADDSYGPMPAGCVFWVDDFSYQTGPPLPDVDLSSSCFGPGCGSGEVITQAASDLALTTAKLNGEGNPGGVAQVGYFEYGLTTSYGQTTPPVALGAGTSYVPFDADITNLTGSRVYHYRARMVPA